MAQRLTSAEVKGLFEKLSNWGKWGKDDQRGTLNLLTLEKRQRAIRLATTGESVSMSLPLATLPAPDNPTPAFHLMIGTGYDLPAKGLQASSDYLAIPTHGRAITHLDALCHMFWRAKMYNGYPATEVGAHGTNKCGIDTSFDGIIGRGVLLDIPKLKNVDWLEKGEKIFPADLEGAEKKHGVRVEEGDILAIRTGRRRPRASPTGRSSWCPSWSTCSGSRRSLPDSTSRRPLAMRPITTPAQGSASSASRRSHENCSPASPA